MPVQDPIDVCRNTRKAKGRGMVEIPAREEGKGEASR
jgi:hypothetical protein